MYHKIRIENQDNLIPQLSKDYLKYYDRLTVGNSFKTIYRLSSYE